MILALDSSFSQKGRFNHKIFSSAERSNDIVKIDDEQRTLSRGIAKLVKLFKIVLPEALIPETDHVVIPTM
jgi:hypothetical protein